jgi:PAS domain S-box-containing protein
MARRLKPDLVLMDIVMPGRVDGIDAATKIRSELDIPIIFLTAFADDAHINRAKGADPFGYIVKPFHEEEVQASIEVALHKRSGEKRLRENEKLYHAIMREAFDPIIITDGQGRVLEANRQAEQLLECERKVLLGSRLERYISYDAVKRSRRGNRGRLLQKVRVYTGSGVELHAFLSKSEVSYNGQRAVLQVLSERDAPMRGRMIPKKLFQFREIIGRLFAHSHETEDSGMSGVENSLNLQDEMLPVCSSCKKIRTSSNDWVGFERYFQNTYGIDFSHGICSECAHKLWPDMPPEHQA